MKRFYLKACGCICYDETGISFPYEKLIKFKDIVRLMGGKNPRWKKHPYSNCPKVLTFDLNNKSLRMLNKFLFDWSVIAIELK